MRWRPLLVLAALVALASGAAGCRVTGKQEMSETASISSVPSKVAPADVCGQRPEPKICCEALTPTCNECRDANRRAQDEWNKKCLSAATATGCTEEPPVIACCGEPTEECARCREAAFDKLMRWKDECANIESIRCDRQPEQIACSAEAIPSSESCHLRNRRMLEEWERRCRR